MSVHGDNYIRFDWAIKRLLRNKANHAVLEGFLSSLLGKKVKIHRFLESESNQEFELDKYNRVDILAETDDKELCIIEVQNSRELGYFQRMLFGVSKTLAERVGLGKPYENVRKIYSVNIVYFELGQGKDYVYHGKTVFRGMNKKDDTLKLSFRQQEKFFGSTGKELEKRKEAGEIFPEYYVLRVNDFDDVATTPLDEWIEFLKTGRISAKAKAAGLSEARECLRVDALSESERRAYYRHMESVEHMKSLFDTSRDEGYQEGRSEGRLEGHEEGRAEGRAEGLAEGRAEGLAEGRAEGLTEGRAEGRAEGKTEGRNEEKIENAKRFLALGLSPEQVAAGTQLPLDEVKGLMEK